MKYLGAIDIGGTKTMVGIVGKETQIIAERTEAQTLPEHPNASIPPDHPDAQILTKRHFATSTGDAFTHFSECFIRFNECLSECRLTVSDLTGIGVNMPGMVDSATGVLLEAPFAGWYDIDVKGYFSRMFGTDRIVVENDVNACAIGELMFGNACDNFLWVTVSTGIGGALIIDRKLVSGSNACAGEIGHVKVEYEHPARCSCGQWGCAEAHGSGTAITRMFAEKVRNDKALAEKLAAKNLAADAMTCSILVKENNPAAMEVFDTAGKYIGRALSYAANLLNPHKIYIGGGVSDSLELLLPAIRKEFNRATVKQCAAIEIVKTALAYDAALMGAAALTLT
jgi:glucokinase